MKAGLLPPTPNERGVTMASKQPQHILLVEDDEDTLSATTAMLERLGYRVRAETEGLEDHRFSGTYVAQHPEGRVSR